MEGFVDFEMALLCFISVVSDQCACYTPDLSNLVKMYNLCVDTGF